MNAGAHVAAGPALARGTAARAAAAVLIGSPLPTAYGGHPYWTFDDPLQRAGQ